MAQEKAAPGELSKKTFQNTLSKAHDEDGFHWDCSLEAGITQSQQWLVKLFLKSLSFIVQLLGESELFTQEALIIISSLQSGIFLGIGKVLQLSLSKADRTNNFSAELKSETSCIRKTYTNLGAVSFKGCGLAQDRWGQAGRDRGLGSPKWASSTFEYLCRWLPATHSRETGLPKDRQDKSYQHWPWAKQCCCKPRSCLQ